MPELTKVQTGFLEPQGPFKLDTGTAGSPGVYFEGDETTGFYRTAEDEIGVSIDGTQKYNFTSEGLKFNGTSLDGTPFMGAIDKDITDTAVDVFVYDTSRDSDGGAWRQRTSHTSWYNEELNTATRGSRREFPSVAVIVAESQKLTIYDGDDPDLPMWMVFNNSVFWGSYSISSCVMINGELFFGINSTLGVRFVKFLEEKIGRYSFNAGVGHWPINIAERSESRTFVTTGTTSQTGLVNSNVNDVAMTVLPTAPIDPDTGLPIPTIAVATNGGISVIKDDGTVINGGDTASISKIHITEKNRLYYTFTSFNQTREVSDESYWTKSGFYGTHQLLINSSPPLPTNSGNAIKVSTESYGTADGLVLHSPDPVTAPNSNNNNGMVAYATTSYNTGWQHGDIKGAFLSDTDATNVTGTELITNGTFDSDTSGWTAVGGATLSVNSGQLVVTGSGAPAAGASQGLTTVVGKRYILTYDAFAGSINVGQIKIGTTPSSFNITFDNNVNSSSNADLYFTATTTTTYITLGLNVGLASSDSFRYDNVSVRLAEPDRSVNAKGLQVFGTITKTPVATGAELVAYSGWSSSNYLRQPYNSDLNAGTGNFHIMCWVKGNQLMLWHRAGDGASTDLRCEFPTSGGSANRPRFYMYNGTSGSVISFYATQAFDTTTWHHCVWVKDSPTTGKLYIDGVLDSSGTASNGPVDITSTSANLTIGRRADTSVEPFNGSVALFRAGASAPSAEQIKKIYNDEKVLFQDNADCTLYGSSDAVTALAYDEKTNLLHVGTSSGRSDFNGLRRINNTTEAVTTAISAYDGSIAQQ